MPNPLDILAGLATAGAGGAAGAFGGEVTGRVLRQQMESEETANKLRVLETILKGQEVQKGQQPTWTIKDGRLVMQPVTGAPRITPLEPLPLTSLQEAQRKGAEASARLHGAQAEQVGVETPLQRAQREGLERGERPAVNVHYERDATGRLTRIITRVDPTTGKVTDDRQRLGPIGMPQRPSAVLTPRETKTTTTKITPRKRIYDVNTMNELQAALPQLVNELSAKPGFNVPGAFVTLPNGMRVRKEEIIARAFQQQHGVEVTVRWDGSRFRIVNAWQPEAREPIETRRTTGPQLSTEEALEELEGASE